MWKEELLKLCHDCWNNIEFRVFCEPNPPTNLHFPDELACSADIKYFYKICNGGYIGHINWFKLEDLIEKNQYWNLQLSNYEDEKSPISIHKFLVMGQDAGGIPLIWSKETNILRAFMFKGGNWEGECVNFSEFILDMVKEINTQFSSGKK
jgi:hypothetical protein